MQLHASANQWVSLATLGTAHTSRLIEEHIPASALKSTAAVARCTPACMALFHPVRKHVSMLTVPCVLPSLPPFLLLFLPAGPERHVHRA
jgi:hypothetical protein